MEEQEQTEATMAERAGQLGILADKFRQSDKRHIDTSWFSDCVATVAVLLNQAHNREDHTTILTILAAAMWQHGYQAAPSLKFVLPEGGQG